MGSGDHILLADNSMVNTWVVDFLGLSGKVSGPRNCYGIHLSKWHYVDPAATLMWPASLG